MDAARANALSMAQLKAFSTALLDAYDERAQLQDMLYYMDRRHALSDGDSFTSCVNALIRAAKSEGWLHLLIDGVLADRPHNAMLRDWLQVAAEPAIRRNEPQLQELVDTAYFDLQNLRREVARTARLAARGGVIAFGFADPDDMFLRKFSNWLCAYFGDAQQKDPLTIRPDITAVERQVGIIRRYRRELDSNNVLCAVRLDGHTPAETVADFWQAVSAAFDGAAHRLVILFAGGPDAAFPAGVTVLPPPRFDIYDVDVWTHEVARRRGWPDAIAAAWTNQLEVACWQGDECSVRVLYEEMDMAIKDAYFDEAAFRRQFEEGARDAYAAPD